MGDAKYEAFGLDANRTAKVTTRPCQSIAMHDASPRCSALSTTIPQHVTKLGNAPELPCCWTQGRQVGHRLRHPPPVSPPSVVKQHSNPSFPAPIQLAPTWPQDFAQKPSRHSLQYAWPFQSSNTYPHLSLQAQGIQARTSIRPPQGRTPRWGWYSH